MFFSDKAAVRAAKQRSVTLFGMSGVGKTYVSKLLREEEWFHYSIDYRIASRYMREVIEDNLKREAMVSPFVRTLLLSDSIAVRAKATIENLAPLSSYLGKPGDPDKGGLSFEHYLRRQREHQAAELAALSDVGLFIRRARDLYGYKDFICDASGSLCEVVNPEDPQDPALCALARHTMLLFIQGSAAHEQTLAQRFDKAPKPMCYREGFLCDSWKEYLHHHGIEHENTVDPNHFMRWGFRKAIKRRAPVYEAIARHWGYWTTPERIASVRDSTDFLALLEEAIVRKNSGETGTPRE